MPTSAIAGLAVKPVAVKPIVARPASATRPVSAASITSTAIMFATIAVASSPEPPDVAAFTRSSSFHSSRFYQHFASIAECLKVCVG